MRQMSARGSPGLMADASTPVGGSSGGGGANEELNIILPNTH
jgi:hypothetical protein